METAQKKLEDLAIIVDANPAAYEKLVKSYNVIPATTHEGKVAQALFMGQNFPDFGTRFSKEVAHEHGYAELGFDFMSIISGVGKAFGGLVGAIKNAVQKGKEKKAAADTGKAAAAEKEKLAAAEKEKAAAGGSKTKVIAGVVIFIIIIGGGIWYFMSKGKKGKKEKE